MNDFGNGPSENSETVDFPQTSDESGNSRKPHFTHPDNLNVLIPKPSGNMVKIRCAASGLSVFRFSLHSEF